MPNSLISVIIPVYNGADFLASALTCVLGQDYDPLEIIIVNDGSTDQTATLAREWVRNNPGQIQIVHRPKGGVAAARNTGLKAARGELIGTLDVDDLWPPGTVSAFAEALTRNPEASAIQGYIRRVWLGSAPGGPRYPRDFVPYLAMNSSSIMLRRSVFDKIGIFDERPSQNEDTDLHLRIREAGLRIFVLERLMLIYRMHSSNLTNDTDFKKADFFKVLHNSLNRRRRQGQRGSLNRLYFLSDEQREWPRISVVIPLINMTSLSAMDSNLKATLASIAAQEYPEMEYIFVHSTPNPVNPAMLSGYIPNARIRLVELPERDLISALNAGALAASGDLIAWCQPGDMWTSHRLRMQLGYLLPGRLDQAVVGLVHFISDPVQPYSKDILDNIDGRSYQDILGTLLMQRSVYITSRGFSQNPEMSPLAAITEWFLRLKESGIHVRQVPHFVISKQIGDLKTASRLKTGELLTLLHGSIKRKRMDI